MKSLLKSYLSSPSALLYPTVDLRVLSLNPLTLTDTYQESYQISNQSLTLEEDLLRGLEAAQGNLPSLKLRLLEWSFSGFPVLDNREKHVLRNRNGGFGGVHGGYLNFEIVIKKFKVSSGGKPLSQAKEKGKVPDVFTDDIIKAMIARRSKSGTPDKKSARSRGSQRSGTGASPTKREELSEIKDLYKASLSNSNSKIKRPAAIPKNSRTTSGKRTPVSQTKRTPLSKSPGTASRRISGSPIPPRMGEIVTDQTFDPPQEPTMNILDLLSVQIPVCKYPKKPWHQIIESFKENERICRSNQKERTVSIPKDKSWINPPGLSSSCLGTPNKRHLRSPLESLGKRDLLKSRSPAGRTSLSKSNSKTPARSLSPPFIRFESLSNHIKKGNVKWNEIIFNQETLNYLKKHKDLLKE